jgi:O-succinylbenzoate synthase
MSDELWIWHYRLKSRRPLNSLSTRREFDGVLIRDSEGGFACLQPWPEFGDPTLQRCLEDLAGPRRRAIVRRAVRCLEMDGAARSLQDPLFDELEVPLSHATLTNLDPIALDQAVASGFTFAKLKCGSDLTREATFLSGAVVKYPALRWRLDFNETSEAPVIVKWLAAFTPEVRAAIDFLEDPCPYVDPIWTALRIQSGVPLAVDREAAPLSAAAQFMVIKPAIDEPWLLAEAAFEMGQKVVVTSYMDHPLGQSFAAWEAGRLELQFPGLTVTAGLQTHHLFEQNEFTEALGPWKPAFQPAPGMGLGFDSLLEKLPWKRLV